MLSSDRVRSLAVLTSTMALATAIAGGDASAQEKTDPDDASAVAEVLEDDAATTSGYDPEVGFALRSADDDWRLRIGLQAGYKFEPIRRDGEWQDRNAFFVIRPIIAGHIIEPWLQFWTSVELASNPPFLLDSYVEIRPWEEFGLRIGQQYTPLSRHEYLGPQEILFPEWAVVADYFWSGRDKGVTALGALADGKFEYWAGIYAGSPLRQFRTIAGNYVLEGRVTVSPIGPVGPTEFPYLIEDTVPFRYSFTIQGYHGNLTLAEANFNPSTFRVDVVASDEERKQTLGSGDVAFQWGRFAGTVEAYVRRTDPDPEQDELESFTSVGVWGQLGIMIVPRHVDVGVRVNWLDASTDLSNDGLWGIEGQVAYHLDAPHFALKARYAYGDQSTPGEDELGAVPLAIPPGQVHLFTLELMLAL